MEPGDFVVKGTGARRLLVGWSWQSLWFLGQEKPGEPRPKKQLILDTPERAAGYLCQQCGAVVMPGSYPAAP